MYLGPEWFNAALSSSRHFNYCIFNLTFIRLNLMGQWPCYEQSRHEQQWSFLATHPQIMSTLAQKHRIPLNQLLTSILLLRRHGEGSEWSLQATQVQMTRLASKNSKLSLNIQCSLSLNEVQRTGLRSMGWPYSSMGYNDKWPPVCLVPSDLSRFLSG